MKTHRASYQVIERNAPSTGAVRSAIRVLLAVILGIVAYIAWAGTQAWDAVLVAAVLALWTLAKGARR